MHRFRKLKKDGSIVFIPEPDEEQSFFDGYNLSSESLRKKRYREDKFHNEWMEKDLEERKNEVKKAFKPIHLYKKGENSKHHDVQTTAMRHREIEKAVFPEKFPSPDPNGFH